MEWRDEGVLLSARPHGETSVVAEVFTAEHGRHAGVVRGGASRRMAAHLQQGAQVAVIWRARLDEHIGVFTLEPLRARAAALGDAGRLAGLTSVCALLRVALPERDPHPALWSASLDLLDRIDAGEADWPRRYLLWEKGLLEDMGFGLDLTRCAVTGATLDLAFVSPRTGRAVSRAGAGDWADRLLPLPRCLTGDDPATTGDILEGLALTGHFLQRELAGNRRGAGLPEARARLLRALGSRG